MVWLHTDGVRTRQYANGYLGEKKIHVVVSFDQKINSIYVTNTNTSI